jgi:ankyrin repeat protein
LWTSQQLDELQELIFRALARDDDALLAKLIIDPNCITRANEKYIYSPLFSACKYNRVKSVKYFFSLLGYSMLTLRDPENGWTCLHHAAANGGVETVRALLEMGADPLENNNNKWNAILLCIMYGKGNCLRTLLRAAPSFLTFVSKTHLAALTKNALLVNRLLLDEAIEPFPLICKTGFPTPLHFACALSRDEESISLLVSKESINAKDCCGRTPLFYAAAANKPNAIRTLLSLSLGAAPLHLLQQTDQHGRTALHTAAMSGATQAVAEILRMTMTCGTTTTTTTIRAMINSRDACGCTALHYALLYGRSGAVAELLHHDADALACPKGTQFTPLLCAFLTNNSSRLLSSLVDKPIPPLVLNRCLFAAAASGDAEGVSSLLRRGALITALDEHRRTVFHFAADGEVVRSLCRHPGGSALLESFPCSGTTTPLHLAARQGNTSALKALVQCGSRVCAEDEEHRTALEVALDNRHEQCAVILTEYENNIQKRFADGCTILHKAARNDFRSLLSSLLRKNIPLDAVGPFCRTALHVAAMKGHQGFVRLLAGAGADQGCADENNMLPLFYAVLSGVVECALALFPSSLPPQGSLPGDGMFEEGNSLLHVLCKFISQGNGMQPSPSSDFPEMIRFLLRKGYSPTSFNDNGETPLHLLSAAEGPEPLSAALENADPNIGDCFQRTPLHLSCQYGTDQCARALLARGARVDQRAQEGCTPLFFACHYGALGCTRLLVLNNANINNTSVNGTTPLHTAASKGHAKIVAFLCEAGASVDAVNDEGETALHSACSSSAGLRAVRALLQAGASPFIKDNHGMTGADIAKQRNHKDTFEFLTNPNFVFPPSPSLSPLHSPKDDVEHHPEEQLLQHQPVPFESKPSEQNTENRIQQNTTTRQTAGFSKSTSKMTWSTVRPSAISTSEGQPTQKRQQNLLGTSLQEQAETDQQQQFANEDAKFDTLKRGWVPVRPSKK